MTANTPEYQRAWYLANREKILARDAAWRTEHLQDARLYEREYQRARRLRQLKEVKL